MQHISCKLASVVPHLHFTVCDKVFIQKSDFVVTVFKSQLGLFTYVQLFLGLPHNWNVHVCMCAHACSTSVYAYVHMCLCVCSAYHCCDFSFFSAGVYCIPLSVWFLCVWCGGHVSMLLISRIWIINFINKKWSPYTNGRITLIFWICFIVCIYWDTACL